MQGAGRVQGEVLVDPGLASATSAVHEVLILLDPLPELGLALLQQVPWSPLFVLGHEHRD